MTRREYPNPPLAEAVCEFRFVPGSPWDGSEPGRFFERFRDEFPRREPVANVEHELTEAADQVGVRVSQQARLRLLSEDGHALLQIGQNHLSVISLRRYMGWPRFRVLIERALGEYRDLASPKGLQRIGLRYINRFDFPMRSLDPEDFFDFYPHIGPQLPQDYSGFLLALHFLYEDNRDALRLQLFDTPSETEGNMACILDLDYFVNRNGAVPDEAVRQWLEDAHQRVEDVFEGCIKPALRAKFEEVAPK